MSAKRRVRSPFVVTIAAAAALLTPGCGARVDVGGGPGPVDPKPECPASTPAQGSACSGELSCNSADTFCGSSAGTIARCENGEWQVSSATCNPPPPDCPAEAPTNGTSCGYYGGGSCEYPDRCVPGGRRSFTCYTGTWAESVAPIEAACPSVPPVDGTSCAECAGRYPSNCVYEYCESTPSREAFCNPVTKQWSTRWLSCNPPPPDGGPGWEDAGTPPDEDAP